MVSGSSKISKTLLKLENAILTVFNVEFKDKNGFLNNWKYNAKVENSPRDSVPLTTI